MTCDVPARYVLLTLIFVGMFIVPWLKLNLSIAIVSMVNSSSTDNANISHPAHDSCSSSQSGIDKENDKSGPFDWDPVDQGLALGCYFYGFVITATLGPWVAKKVGFKIVLGVAVSVSSILTLLLPRAAYGGLIYFVVLRIIIGFCQGVVSSTCVSAFPAWVPLKHRTKTFSVIICGNFLGHLATLPISAMISEYINWETVFYITGSFALIWSILWFALAYNSPEQHPRISEKEKKYLLENTNVRVDSENQKQPVPWVKIMTSLPFLATIICHIALEWTLAMTSIVLPTYLTRMLDLGLIAAGAASGSPWFVKMIVALVGERIANILKARKVFSLLTIRKGLITLATVTTAICFVVASYTGCSQIWAVIIFFFVIVVQGLHVPGTEANLFDLTDRYCGILFGILLTISQFSGFLVPQITGLLLHSNSSITAWRTIFFITAGVNIFAAIIFCIFGSAEEQPWSKQIYTVEVD